MTTIRTGRETQGAGDRLIEIDGVGHYAHILSFRRMARHDCSCPEEGPR